MKSRPTQFVVLAGGALALFFAGRFVGGAFADREPTAVTAADSPSTVSAILPKVVDHRGVSMFVAERDGYSQTARDLLALFEIGRAHV